MLTQPLKRAGFPACSHQYRDLIPAQTTRFSVIAPDYPGFGTSDMPDPASFTYTCDKRSEVMEALLKDRGFDRYGLFGQDYGGPVGFRIVTTAWEYFQWKCRLCATAAGGILRPVGQAGVCFTMVLIGGRGLAVDFVDGFLGSGPGANGCEGLGKSRQRRSGVRSHISQGGRHAA